MSIHKRIALTCAGLIAAAILTFGAMSYQSGRTLLWNSVRERLNAVSTNQGDKISDIVVAWKDRTALIASRTQLRISLRAALKTGDTSAQSRIRRILDDATTSVRSVRQVEILSHDGRTFALVGKVNGLTRHINFQVTDKTAIHLVDMRSNPQGESFVRISAPLILDQELIGYLRATLDADELVRSVNDTTGLGASGETMVAVTGGDGRKLYLTSMRHSRPEGADPIHVASFPPMLAALQGNETLFDNAIDYRGERTMAATRYIPELGWGVVVKMDWSEILAPVREFLHVILLVGGVLGALALGVGILIARNITRPLAQLAQDAQHIEAGNHLIRSNEDVSDAKEIRILARSLNQLADSLIQSNANLEERVNRRTHELAELNDKLEELVAARTSELIVANENLSTAMEDLKQTQKELVHSEKMAALGGLVAGVAHELNTPIGIGITGASHLQEALLSIRRKDDEAQLTRSDLTRFMDAVDRACELLLTHLTRAATLVGDFKQVAVDQSNPDIRNVDLRTYMDKVVSTLQPNFKQILHRVTVDIPQDLTLSTCPGALAQALTALASNSVIHAFTDETPDPTITIRAEESSSGCRLIFQDNGKGIPKDILPRIFEPFFTTNRKAGGSGLGLSIAHTIVTDTLKGAIKCELPDEGGTAFVIDLPNMDIPDEGPPSFAASAALQMANR